MFQRLLPDTVAVNLLSVMIGGPHIIPYLPAHPIAPRHWEFPECCKGCRTCWGSSKLWINLLPWDLCGVSCFGHCCPSQKLPGGSSASISPPEAHTVMLKGPHRMKGEESLGSTLPTCGPPSPGILVLVASGIAVFGPICDASETFTSRLPSRYPHSALNYCRQSLCYSSWDEEAQSGAWLFLGITRCGRESRGELRDWSTNVVTADESGTAKGNLKHCR